MKVARFLAISVVITLLMAAAGRLVQASYFPDAPTVGVWTAAAMAFVASTGGWLIVLYGLLDDPARGVLWFGLGLMAKVVLIGFGALAFVATGVVSLSDLLVPFVASFLVLGFVQCGLVVKEAIKRSGG